MAKRASIAVPALAVSGVLAAAPQALAATTPRVHAAPVAAAARPISAQLDAAVRRADPSFTTYTVQPGDTLSGIALRLLGRASNWRQLYSWNRSKISNPDVIQVGQVLDIPRHLSAAKPHSTARPDSTARPHSTGGGDTGGGRTTGGGHSTRNRHGSTSQHRTGSDHSGRHVAAQSKPASTSGSPSLAEQVQQDVANGNYLLAVGQYLVENGYSDAAAAGVASCVYGESTGNPESVGTGGGGLIGWTPIGSAEPNSNIITGNPAQDMMAQLSDLLYYNSSEIGQALVAQLNTISDPVAAADFFSQNFEKPAVTDSDVVPSVAEQIYSQLSS